MNNSEFCWPENYPFALFLSHDIDQIDDRELFRILADLNHIRRIFMQGEKGSVLLALRRLLRALFVPKPADKDFKTILEIESRYRFHSSFYVLHDPYWSRNGPRYTLKSKALHRIVNMINYAGCEVGLHGGYYRFNQAGRYRESCEALRLSLGIVDWKCRTTNFDWNGVLHDEQWIAVGEKSIASSVYLFYASRYPSIQHSN